MTYLSVRPMWSTESIKGVNALLWSYFPLKEGRKCFILRCTQHILFKVIWLRTILIMREETRCRHIGYSFRLTARVLLYAPSHRPDNTYHGLCYTSCGALAGTRNSSMGPPWRINPTTHRTMSERSYHGATSRSQGSECFTTGVTSPSSKATYRTALTFAVQVWWK